MDTAKQHADRRPRLSDKAITAIKKRGVAKTARELGISGSYLTRILTKEMPFPEARIDAFLELGGHLLKRKDLE